MMILQGGQTPYIWTLKGTVLSGVAPDETNNVGEPNVLYDSNPQILAGPNVFKMWYTSGWATPAIHYAESADGISWTKYGSNPVLATHDRSSVFKDGSTYYMFAANVANTQIDLYSSADGISWSLVQSAAIGLGAGGAWDDTAIANTCVWKEGAGDYRMLYEARHTTGPWKIGYATSADLTSWSKSGSNPVISETGSVGGPFVYKRAASDYWLWVHHSLASTMPTDLERYQSSDLTTWTKDPPANILTRGPGDGNASANGQIADPILVEQGGMVYMWYSGNPDGSAVTGHSVIKLVTSSHTLSSLVNTPEGP